MKCGVASNVSQSFAQPGDRIVQAVVEIDVDAR